MPHQCTNCGRTFPDGSKEMLSGCPDCGGNKFQFEPSGSGSVGPGGTAEPDDAPASTRSDEPASGDASASGEAAESGVSATVSQAKQTVSDWVGRDGKSDDAASASGSGGSPQDAADQRSSSPGSASPRKDAGSRDAASEPSLADAREDADAERSRSNIESTGDWPDVGSRDPTDDPTRSGDHPSRPDDSTARPADSSTPTGDDSTRTPGPEADQPPSSEDAAQANARTDVVDPNDLPRDSASEDAGGTDHPFDGNEEPPADADGQVVGTPDDEQPDLEALRQELNEQFESIKIVRPGEYELNLMELYDRDEYIISLMEDGRYAIEVPDAWRDGE